MPPAFASSTVQAVGLQNNNDTSFLAFVPGARWARRIALASAVMGVAALVLATLQASPASAADRYRYEIVNGSGLRADVMWASTNPFQGVFLWRDNNSASQEFDLLDAGRGYFRIRARHSGQCLMLDWRGGPYTNGTRVIQYPSKYCRSGYASATVSAPAEWRVRWLSGTRCSDGVCRTGLDRMTLINRRTGRCLDAANPYGRRPPARAVLQQWDCVKSTSAWNMGNQSWYIGPPGTRRID